MIHIVAKKNFIVLLDIFGNRWLADHGFKSQKKKLNPVFTNQVLKHVWRIPTISKSDIWVC